MKILKYLVFFVLSTSVALFFACGGGGGSGSGSGSSGGTGSVAVFVADSPADTYEAINIWVTEISLIPPDGSGRSPVIIFRSRSAEGCKINLLDHRDGEDFLLTLKKQVPAGLYEKIRLRISKIESEGGDCDLELIKLPSGKIDLNPRGMFEIEEGEILGVRLDIDANKSINLHQAGNSGKCIFRPVVFVHTEPITWMLRCPRIIKGTITDLIYENGNAGIEGFTLDLSSGRGDLNVHLSSHTVLFGEDGLPAADRGILEDKMLWETVWVRGKLDSDGHFQASEVVMGRVIPLKGTVQSLDDDDTFTMSIEPGQSVVDDTISVRLSRETLVLVGCDRHVNRSAISPGLPVRVVGKLFFNDGYVQAVAVFLKPISGELISGNPASYSYDSTTVSGYGLIIRVDESTDITVFLPGDASIRLVGDGVVPINLLCPGRKVFAVIDPEQSEQLSVLTASEIKVQPDQLGGTVEEIDGTGRLLIIGGETVKVDDGATIMDLHKNQLVDFGWIKRYDKVSCFGLVPCDNDESENDFYAFAVLIMED